MEKEKELEICWASETIRWNNKSKLCPLLSYRDENGDFYRVPCQKEECVAYIEIPPELYEDIKSFITYPPKRCAALNCSIEG